ncbi:RB1-inducible coiled-coil protein 1-like isoform X1 [Acipenser ruthenus]|uniref:RB1-inducible coiled-coil protein 1-like isoform X1 n=1 Tax=Acipenser ruthenus TaxID=7906 RepID=UPI002741316B|nr:RB1-inducible coiled-coil protein 1-like isoform X1 [Acipenser ruthenus]XP_058872806.1 RB1-inducible coiled-coil protein 1-like isoform X1 [Acipenser ruthenus]XP_058872814.1 RB1-inducible coiled-coil protein 1-like isoform X1 [Acipenser ruthenus]
MNLYVFQVNNGSTLTFDTELAVQTVADLKHAIQVKYKIATQHQVLVVNGGECMVADRRVCSYSAGTDTNPIFLFNKEMILCDRPPAIPKTTFSVENEMELKVEESLMMPAVFHTVASRTQLAVEMFEVAKKLCSFCERLVHDEHLQHQGWAAIMANLDDCTLSYQKLLCKFETAYNNYQQSIEDIKQKLASLGNAVSVMAKIPLLECLTRHSYKESLERLSSPADQEGAEDETDEEKSTESVLHSGEPRASHKSSASFSISVEHPTQDCATQEDKETSSKSQDAVLQDCDPQEKSDLPLFNVSLLDWINVQDRPNDVESVVRKCFDSINRLDPRIIQPFLAECRDTIAKLDNQNMKAIKGLEDRLYALDQMIASCKKLVNEQKELAQGFLANQKRAENLKDTSVLPDLCLSHANQLMIMLTNHRKLLDIKQKCTTAKQELANNLQVRLKWCCYVMLHADQDGEKLQALLRLLTELLERVRVVEALGIVPQMYCLAVVEVVRRKIFIKHYREWTNALVKDGKQLYEAEKAKRDSFGKLFRKSFLRNRLFRGLDSWPPTSFCTRKPRKFDFELPEISLCDLQFLQSCCPPEVQSFLRVPTLCDFEPLHQHVQVLHQLVKAAQSVDEMSKTITDLLSEQKASSSQPTPKSTIVPRSESTTGAASTSSKTPPSLNLQGGICQPLSLHGLLEDLSPDSIDAHTFDFETIGHPNMDTLLKQGSLDLDSLAESPESDFMSAVNEFVIEENLTSPNVISDPQSPEMMVESLYSSVINAIDNRRIQDTTTLEKENTKVAMLKVCIEKYRSAAEESQGSLKSIKEDLCHFRGLVQKEQRDFSFALKSVSGEVRNIIDNIKYSHNENLKEMHQHEQQILQRDYENETQRLREESNLNQKNLEELKKVLLELEEGIENKESEISLLKNEKDMFLESENSKDQKLLDLEQKMLDQNSEIQELLQSRESLKGDLAKLYLEIEDNKQKLKLEFENLEKSHLKELEERLQIRHAKELHELERENLENQENIVKENQEKLHQMQELHASEVQARENHLKELEVKVSELSDIRCKLEVEIALKEAETEEIRLLLDETRSQQQETVRIEVEKETDALRREINDLKHQLQAMNDEYEVGLAELRALMRIEKDHCISELVDSHEEETTLLHSELTSLQKKAMDVERGLKEQIRQFQNDLDNQINAQEKEKEEKERDFQEQQQHFNNVICGLQEENKLLSSNLQQEKQTNMQIFNKEKEEAVKAALADAFKDFEHQKKAIEEKLLEKVKQLENQLKEKSFTEREVLSSSHTEALAGKPLTSNADLQEKLHEERASLLGQLERLEKTKNEEMQTLKTSLIAEQQMNFNTVVTREKLKKEQIINELNDKLKKAAQQQERDKDLIETLSEDRANLLQEKKQLEEELNKMRSSSLVSSAFFSSANHPAGADLVGACAAEPHVDSERLASVAAIGEDGRIDSAVEASMMAIHENIPVISEEKQRIILLERTLHIKEEENKRLNQRLMSQSMSSVSSRHSEKIAIRDFQVGDLVLIILDERHDNYVLFTVGPTLYFLHSESLAALDLKPASGAPRRPWVLGKVMEKEYCQAKKAQNRFKVPLGTKFYRVKAVPWNKKV